MTREVLAVALGYLCGSIPFGILVSRVAGARDPRTVGSGNIGATNVMRAGGKGLGSIVLALDALKGFAAPVLVQPMLALGPDQPWVLASGFAALVGHCYPVWLKGRGGKGVATALGVGLALFPLVTAAALVVFAVVMGARRIVSLASLSAMAAALVAAALLGTTGQLVLVAAITALIVWRHRGNLARLRHGQERPLDAREP